MIIPDDDGDDYDGMDDPGGDVGDDDWDGDDTPSEDEGDGDIPNEGNGGSSSGESSAQPGEGDSGTGGITSQSEDVIASVGRLTKRKDKPSRAGGYGKGGRKFKVASDQPGGKIPTGIVFGCTDETAANYNPVANLDDGSCQKLKIKKPDSKVISAFSKFLQGPPSKLDFPELGIFNKFLGIEKFSDKAAGRTGIVLNTSEEYSETTAGSSSFKAGTERITNSSFSSEEGNGEEKDKFTLVYDALPNYIKAAYMISTQKECGDCDEKFVDDFLKASSLLTATALAGECVSYADSIAKVKSLSTSLMNRKCKNC